MKTNLLSTRKIFKAIAALTLLLMGTIFINSNVSAQVQESGDTLIIGPQHPDGTMVGALNYYFYADTTATGERAHSVYKLHRGAQYLLTERIISDFPLTIVADKPDDLNAPPIIRTSIRDDGTTVENLFEFYDDATLVNLFISGIAPSGDSPSEWMIILLDASDKVMTFEGCYFENIYSWWGFIEDWGSNNVQKYINCYFRNFGEPGGVWNGAIMGAEPPADSLIYRNCSFFNFDCCATSMSESQGALYTEFDHCTFANTAVHQFILNKPVTAKITNNIFYNCNGYSEYPQEVSSHADKEFHGIIHFFQFNSDILNETWQSKYDPNNDGTLTEDERSYELKNNLWYYSDGVKQYWDIDDSIFDQSWYNNAVREFFVNNEAPKDWVVYDLQGNPIDTVHMAAHPMFVEENTMNMDPQFENTGNSDDLFVDHLIASNKLANGISAEPVYWFYDPDGNPTTFQWPLSESLKPMNTSLENAGTDGKPLGSLQWWSEYSAVNDGKNKTNFSLQQNAPNPFVSSTIIEYAIEEKNHVELSVFNLLGAKVACLVDDDQVVGKYQIRFEDKGNEVGGVYYYTLKVGNYSVTKKMISVK